MQTHYNYHSNIAFHNVHMTLPSCKQVHLNYSSYVQDGHYNANTSPLGQKKRDILYGRPHRTVVMMIGHGFMLCPRCTNAYEHPSYMHTYLCTTYFGDFVERRNTALCIGL